ncbi:uncharacterized protein LOC119661927 [Teleopsis dalmanni]|uniref:uncharacterized protein LOC119661927 n=1 Tax=Teleopsis dalmanni TaxID=139649 RepID=UPI0018CED216|nr:uncharacterized protein LOC119661927 [Teleopsis dalmanni]
MSERDICLYKLKLAKCAQRYDDMIVELRKLAAISGEFSPDEQRLLTVAYKYEVDLRRTSWRNLVALEDSEPIRSNCDRFHVMREYRAEIEKELYQICEDIIEYLDRALIPCDGTTESKIFCSQLRADYNRYMAEVEVGTGSQIKTDWALAAYKCAYDIAVSELIPTDPLRLGVALNYSVFFYEVIKSSNESCRIAKDSFNAAIVDMHKLNSENYQETTSIMQTLWNNLQFWSTYPNYGSYSSRDVYPNYTQYPDHEIGAEEAYHNYPIGRQSETSKKSSKSSKRLSRKTRHYNALVLDEEKRMKASAAKYSDSSLDNKALELSDSDEEYDSHDEDVEIKGYDDRKTIDHVEESLITNKSEDLFEEDNVHSTFEIKKINNASDTNSTGDNCSEVSTDEDVCTIHKVKLSFTSNSNSNSNADNISEGAADDEICTLQEIKSNFKTNADSISDITTDDEGCTLQSAQTFNSAYGLTSYTPSTQSSSDNMGIKEIFSIASSDAKDMTTEPIIVIDSDSDVKPKNINEAESTAVDNNTTQNEPNETKPDDSKPNKITSDENVIGEVSAEESLPVEENKEKVTVDIEQNIITMSELPTGEATL